VRESTLDKWAEFLVRFAADNLDHYREGDWMNKREEFAEFLQAGTEPFVSEAIPGQPAGPNGPHLQDFTETHFRRLQSDIRNVLEFYVARATPKGITASPKGIVDGPGVRLGLRVSSVYRFGTPTEVTLKYLVESSMITARGKTRDCILGRLIEILRKANPKPFMRCPQCRQIFYRKGKQIFCSRTCTNREMTQRMRKREAEAMKTKPRKTKKGRKTIHGKTKTEKTR
jgi:hypothetical protein